MRGEGLDAAVRLPDGRSLSYRECGAPGGTPVFFFHGMPGSRYQCPDDGVALEQRVRLIAPERPGYGLSDAPPESYSFASWARDVGALAAALGIDRFAVAGYSIGGVFALACAHELPRRVTEVGLIGSLAPLDVPGNWQGLGSVRGLYELAQKDLDGLRRALESLTTPEAFLGALAETICESDRRLLDESPLRDRFLRDCRETLRRGSGVVLREFVLAAHPWGINVSRIAVPTTLWHGLDDINAPPAMAQYLAANIPGCRARFYPAEGHLLMFAHWREILTALA